MSRTARVAASRTTSFGVAEIASCAGFGGASFSSADAALATTIEKQAARTEDLSSFRAKARMPGLFQIVTCGAELQIVAGALLILMLQTVPRIRCLPSQPWPSSFRIQDSG